MFLVSLSFFSLSETINAGNYPIFNDVDPPNNNPSAKSNLSSGWYNCDQIVTLSMNVDGSIYYTTNGKKPTNTSRRYTIPLVIKSSTTLKFIAIDLAGNKSPVYTSYYKIDKTAPYVKSTIPKTHEQKFTLWGLVKIKFSETVLKGPKYNKIYIKNLNTGKKTHITKKLGKNKFTITQKRSRLHHNTYIVYLPKGAFKDRAGNLSPEYNYTFKTQ